MEKKSSIPVGVSRRSSIMQAIERLKQIARMKYASIFICFTLIIVLAVIIFRNFLFTSDWPAGGDVMGWISRVYLFGRDSRWLYVWRPLGLGFVEGISSLDFLLMLIYSACRDASVTIKIFMFSSFLTAGFSMYAFAYRYTRKHMAALSASMIYMLNQLVFSQFTEAHIDVLFSYALAPLLFLLVVKAIEERKFKDILALALALLIFATGFHSECIVIYGTFLTIFVVTYVLFPTKSDNLRKRTKNLLKIGLPVGTIFLLLSIFSWLPFLLNVRAQYYSSAYTYPLEETIFRSHKNLIDAFTLRGVESWGYMFVLNIPEGMSLPDFPISIFLLCLFALAYGTILLRRDRYTVFFAVSSLISMFISKGPYPPFGSFFIWAWSNIPHFAVFRAASRWAVMTSLSHAFFVSVLVSILTDYIQKRRHLHTNKVFLSPKKLHVNLGILNKINKIAKRFSHWLCLIVLILILLSGFFSCWFFFSQGLQVYTPSQNYIEPYEWMANQSGDFRIVTVSRSAAEWVSAQEAESDFAYSGMITNIGWGHDIGYESSFLHDRPTLQDGGWEPQSRAFVDHLRFRLVRHYLTDDLLKMLGTFNCKYVVLPSYITANTRNFFLNQQGYQLVYNQSSVILENEYYTSRIFPTTQHLFIVGGLESFSSLYSIDAFNLNKTALIFAHQMGESSPFANTLFNSSKALIFVNSELLDAIMLSLKDDVTLISAAEHGFSSLDHTKYWVMWPSWRIVGGLVLNENTLTTSGQNSLSIPFKIETDGFYDIWIRIGFASNRGKLSVAIDGVLRGEILPVSNFWARLKWVNMTRLDLKQGDHIITLENDGTGYNDIDSIAIVKPSLFQFKANEVLNDMRNFKGVLIFMLEAESSLEYDSSSGWYCASIPYNGFVLRTQGTSATISTKVSVPKEGRYKFAFRLVSGPEYGNLTINVNINKFVDTISCFSPSQGFKWYEVGPASLNDGEQNITIISTGKIEFDKMILYSLKEDENVLSLNQLFKSSSSGPSISYENINPAKYNVHVNSTEPFLLIFSDSYHPLWKAYVDGVETSPIIAYSMVNGFLINKLGEFDVTLYFTGQTYADIGLKISLATLILVMVAIAIPPSKIERIRKYIGYKHAGWKRLCKKQLKSLREILRKLKTARRET